MSAFTGELTLTHLAKDSQRWRLASSFAYEVGHKGSGRVIDVPIGFETDGSSLPRFLWMLDPPLGRAVRAALIHDVGYARLRIGNPHPEMLTRQKADAVFYEALRAAGVTRVLAGAMWLAVRAFGRANREGTK